MFILCTVCLFALPYKHRKSLLEKKGICMGKSNTGSGVRKINLWGRGHHLCNVVKSKN